MSVLCLHFLGTLDIRCDDQHLPKPPTAKSQSLLAYLVLHRHQVQPRERLAGLFWGDRSDRKARRSLTTALWHIRRCLPQEGLLLSDAHSAQFDPQANLWLDVDEFESLASRGDVSSLQAAVAIYRGNLLSGFYDDWVLNERYRLETLFGDALARLMVSHEMRGEHDAALTTALRLLRGDPLRGDAYRAAMRACCQLGQRHLLAVAIDLDVGNKRGAGPAGPHFGEMPHKRICVLVHLFLGVFEHVVKHLLAPRAKFPLSRPSKLSEDCPFQED